MSVVLGVCSSTPLGAHPLFFLPLPPPSSLDSPDTNTRHPLAYLRIQRVQPRVVFAPCVPAVALQTFQRAQGLGLRLALRLNVGQQLLLLPLGPGCTTETQRHS